MKSIKNRLSVRSITKWREQPMVKAFVFWLVLMTTCSGFCQTKRSQSSNIQAIVPAPRKAPIGQGIEKEPVVSKDYWLDIFYGIPQPFIESQPGWRACIQGVAMCTDFDQLPKDWCIKIVSGLLCPPTFPRLPIPPELRKADQ